MVFYRTKGYFDAERFDAVQAQVLAARVTEGTSLLRRFGTDVVNPA
jgi:GMP synthase (glutamine-hydrolysing)